MVRLVTASIVAKTTNTLRWRSKLRWWGGRRWSRTHSTPKVATKAGRSRRFGPNPRPDFSGDFHPASREIKQERRST